MLGREADRHQGQLPPRVATSHRHPPRETLYSENQFQTPPQTVGSASLLGNKTKYNLNACFLDSNTPGEEAAPGNRVL